MMRAMRTWSLIALGGALGAVARAAVAQAIHARWPSPLPWGTIVVNVSGCLILGLLIGTIEARPNLSSAWRAFGAVGVLGAFTTFSTFEAETFALLQRGAVVPALVNVAVSLIIGLLAFGTGHAIARAV